MDDTLAIRYTNCNSHPRIVALSGKLLNCLMETIEEMRMRNLRTLIARAGSQVAFSEKTGKAPAQVSQWITGAPNSKTGTPRTPSSETCREIEAAFGEPRGWMDHDHRAESAVRGLMPYQRAILETVERMDDSKRKAFQAAGDALAEPARPRRGTRRTG